MGFKNETDRFDQHFLIEQKIIDRFVFEANFTDNDIVVEIGPGKGNITKLIASKVKKLYVIEIDERLKQFLEPITHNYKNIELIFNNVLDTFIPECDKIITSLPYSIVEPFINKLIKCQFKELTMITGSRFAENVLANKKTKLSLLTNCYFEVEKIMDIIPESFDPKPRVMSSMIRLKPKEVLNIQEKELVIFRFLFYFKEKKLKNALIEALIKQAKINDKCLTQKEAKKIIDSLNIELELLEKEFMLFSNEELEYLFKKINLLD